ncbi:hypothetical protein HMPREF0083_00105 [Aneurinibacillus aneurinilyticus ATCC 12856]|uniref:Uncharacterized protein n=1 Tax=Aneurinibacillus aneurinilyticus ATCC 12856 TaxID=649747 RepID=U1YI67_ANEAE|nr:hypothetical protein HMPREF0083_00105 [Aneurinibacillus aneurinilyticus ATCC 12856]
MAVLSHSSMDSGDDPTPFWGMMWRLFTLDSTGYMGAVSKMTI